VHYINQFIAQNPKEFNNSRLLNGQTPFEVSSIHASQLKLTVDDNKHQEDVDDTPDGESVTGRGEAGRVHV